MTSDNSNAPDTDTATSETPTPTQKTTNGATPTSQTKPQKELQSPVDDDEQDLSDEEDDYEEPSIQRYLPGVSVNLRLIPVYQQVNGERRMCPMIVDFYNECLKTYSDEKNFIYEESYLKLTNGEKPTSEAIDVKPTAADESALEAVVSNGAEGAVTLDDVTWLRNRPNDPLLRCIRSITDRLNIQGIVGDPTSYLKQGGDDMHYDIDDPFIDDAAMFNELRTNRHDILLRKEKEDDFSIWSQEEEDEAHFVELQPSAFICHYASALEEEIRQEAVAENESKRKLFLNPQGWRTFANKIPKGFHSIFADLESGLRANKEPTNDKILKCKVKQTLQAIFQKLLKVSERMRSPKEEKADSIQDKRGLNCMHHGRIINPSGRLFRWILACITSITNACSPYDINKEFLALVLQHNSLMLQEVSNRISSKLDARLEPKKTKTSLFYNFVDGTRKLTKNIGLLRKMTKEYKEGLAATKQDNKGRRKRKGETTSDEQLHDENRQGKLSNGVETSDAAISNDANSSAGEKDEKTNVNDDDLEDGDQGDEEEEEDDGDSDDATTPLDKNAHANHPEIARDPAEDSKESGDDDTVKSQGAESATATKRTYRKRRGSSGLAEVFRQSKVWKRIKDVLNIYKLVSSDLINFIQVANLCLAVCVNVKETDFDYMVENNLTLQPVFDQSYAELGELMSEKLAAYCGTKQSIPVDVSRVVIGILQERHNTPDMYERRFKHPLMFPDNDQTAAMPGTVTTVSSCGRKRKNKAISNSDANEPSDSNENNAKRKA